MGNISRKLSCSSSMPLLQRDETTNVLQAAIKKNDEGKESETFFHVVQASIPQEIIIEILSRLPAKSLLRLKCVCKQWYALIQNRHFIEKHMSRGIILNNSIYVFRIIYKEGKMIHGRDGLSLEIDYPSKKYCIRNRATRKRLDLPDPCKDWLSMTLSYVPSSGEYKVVSISMNYERWEVLTVGEDKSWRPFFPNLQGYNMKSQRTMVVSAGSAVHCIRIIEGCSKFAAEVVSFDLEVETFTSIVLPRELFSDWRKAQALDWNGFLSFSEILKGTLNVMVLEDYKNSKWVKEKIIVPLTFLKKKLDSREYPIPLIARSGNLWFWFTCDKNKIISYDLEAFKINWELGHSWWFNVFPPFYFSPSSLVMLKGMRPGC